MSTYVDNLFVAGRNCFGVPHILDDMDDLSASQWEFKIKPTIRQCMAPFRAADTSETHESKWPFGAAVTCMKVLGHYVEHDGGTDICFDNTLGQCWKAFFGNCVSKHSGRMPVKARLGLVARLVSLY